MLPTPKKLLKQGPRSGPNFRCVHERDFLRRLRTARFAGGTLAFAQISDLIVLDVPNRKLNLLVSEEELAKRHAAWTPPQRKYERGFTALYLDHVTQADQGCDFDFFHAGAPTPEPEIH